MKFDVDPQHLFPPRERAQLQRLLDRVADAERRADAAYEVGDFPAAEHWDVETVNRVEDFEAFAAALEESEPVPGAYPDAQVAEADLASWYSEFLQGFPNRGGGGVELLVGMVRNEYGFLLHPDVTDEEILSAARDAFEAREALKGRYRRGRQPLGYRRSSRGRPVSRK